MCYDAFESANPLLEIFTWPPNPLINWRNVFAWFMQMTDCVSASYGCDGGDIVSVSFITADVVIMCYNCGLTI